MTREEKEPTREEVINKLIEIKNFNYSLAPFLNKAISDIKRTENLEELLSGVSHGDVLRDLRFSELEAENARLKEGIAKVKAEIEALPKTYPFVNHMNTYVKEEDVKNIIDRYRAEMTENYTEQIKEKSNG